MTPASNGQGAESAILVAALVRQICWMGRVYKVHKLTDQEAADLIEQYAQAVAQKAVEEERARLAKIEESNRPYHEETSREWEEILGPLPHGDTGCWQKRARAIRDERDALRAELAEAKAAARLGANQQIS